MKSCLNLNLRRAILKIRCSDDRKPVQFLCSIGFALVLGCEGETPPIRPDWQKEEHAVCPHLVADIPDGLELLDVSGYDGLTPNYWELRKIDNSTLEIKHSDREFTPITLNLFPSYIDREDQVYLKESPNPNQTFAWIETNDGIHLYHFERGKGVIAHQEVKGNSDETNWTHRLVWLENQPYIFSLKRFFRGIRAPIHLAKLLPDLSVERSWNTSFCLIEFEEECNDDDDNDESNEGESDFHDIESFAIPSQVSPSANSSRLSIGVEVESFDAIAEDDLLRHPPQLSSSSTTVRRELLTTTHDSSKRSNVYILRYYNEPSGLKYRTVHAFSRDQAPLDFEEDDLIEVTHSPWATYILAPNNDSPQQAQLAHVPNDSNWPINHSNPFESPSHLIQRANGSLIGSLKNGRLSYGRIKHHPELGSVQLGSTLKDTFSTVGAGLILIPRNDGQSKLISLNCNTQPQAPENP